jgi:hypothetical protein
MPGQQVDSGIFCVKITHKTSIFLPFPEDSKFRERTVENNKLGLKNQTQAWIADFIPIPLSLPL